MEAGAGQIEQLLARLAALETQTTREIAALTARLREAEARAAPSQPGRGTGESPPSGRTPRRALLRGAGAGAAAFAAAGLVAAREQLGGATPAARAADGDPILLGQANAMSTATTLQPVPSATPDPLLVADNSAGAGRGLVGIGAAETNGVEGAVSGASSYGVVGYSDQGYGVVGNTLSGIDLFAAGTGRLRQFPACATGAPTTGSYARGEQLRDANGDLFLCIADGSPGTWKRVLLQGEAAAINVEEVDGTLAVTATTLRLPNGTLTDEGGGQVTYIPARGASPLTTAGDLIVGGAAGAEKRLAKGTDGQYLAVDPTTHLLDWRTIDGGDLGSGTIATARLGSGTADTTTFLRGDQTWAVPPGGGGGQVWPEYAVLWAEDSKAVVGGEKSFFTSASQHYGLVKGLQGNGNACEWYFALKYSMQTLGITYNGCPKIDYTLDGSALVTGEDWYSSGGLVFNVRKANTVTVATDGNHTLRATVNGRNAGNTTDYDWLATRIRFRKA